MSISEPTIQPTNGSDSATAMTNGAASGAATPGIYDRRESEVRSYCRSWPTEFVSATGSTQTDTAGRTYIDFFAGAGALSYGHNHPVIKEALIEFLAGDGVMHSLDTHTTTKRTFLETFERLVLEPRGLDYKVMFPGPTGTNAVESALKLARKATGRDSIISFTNAFHGMTLGSLAITGNAVKRSGAGVPLTNTVAMSFDSYVTDDSVDTIAFLDQYLTDGGSGVGLPAACILETVQAEGGTNPASVRWIQRLAELCREHGILLIIDDIQVGCGRTGPFFSWEEMGIEPDIVCLSKSISGSGLPLALVLIKPRYDVWEPGEHNGTFRGNNSAFVTGTAALEHFWADDELTKQVDAKAALVTKHLEALAEAHPGVFEDVRGRGLIQGIECLDPEMAGRIAAEAFDRGLLIETAGFNSQVVKILPPLVIATELLEAGLHILEASVEAVVDAESAELLTRDPQTIGDRS